MKLLRVSIFIVNTSMLGVQVLSTGIVVDGKRMGCYKHVYIPTSDTNEAAHLACEKVFEEWDQYQTDRLIVRSTKVWQAQPEDDIPGDIWFDARPWYRRWFSRGGWQGQAAWGCPGTSWL